MVEEVSSAKHQAYERIHASDDFATLRRAYRGFAFPVTIAFMVWYLLYVLMSTYAHDFMSTQVVGNVNVALVFGLLQFASTFLIAIWYARHANRKLDPIAAKLQAEFEKEDGR